MQQGVLKHFTPSEKIISYSKHFRRKRIEIGRYRTDSEWVFNSLISRRLHRLCLSTSDVFEHDLLYAVVNVCCRICYFLAHNRWILMRS